MGAASARRRISPKATYCLRVSISCAELVLLFQGEYLVDYDVVQLKIGELTMAIDSLSN